MRRLHLKINDFLGTNNSNSINNHFPFPLKDNDVLYVVFAVQEEEVEVEDESNDNCGLLFVCLS